MIYSSEESEKFWDVRSDKDSNSVPTITSKLGIPDVFTLIVRDKFSLAVFVIPAKSRQVTVQRKLIYN